MKKSIIKIILSIVQILIFIPPIIIQYLSKKKMGLMRYLVFKNKIFSEGMFSSNMMLLYKIFIILGAVFCIAALLYNFNKRNYVISVKSLTGAIVINIVVLICVFSNVFEELLANYFFLIAFFIIIVLQYIKVFLDYICSNNKNRRN